MNSSDIIAAVAAPLEQATLPYPVVFPDVKGADTLPRAEVNMVLSPPRRLTIDGEHHEITGEMRIQIISENGTGVLDDMRLGEQAAALYQVDDRYEIPGGRVHINRKPQVGVGIPGDADWRVPVRVFFRANS